jgi:hypothetical protein
VKEKNHQKSQGLIGNALNKIERAKYLMITRNGTEATFRDN